MNRGRFIGIAGLPVLFLGAPTVANEVNGTVDSGSPAATVRDAEWAARWKAAAAELAAQKVARRELKPAVPRRGASSTPASKSAAAAPRSAAQQDAEEWARRW